MSESTGVQVLPVQFISQGESLVGTVHVAEGSDRGALLLQGWGGTRYGPQRILVDASRELAAQGITCMRFDFRGRGDSQGAPSAVTLDGMIEDTMAAVQWLKEQQGVKRFTFLGLCSGANVSIGVASLIPDETDAVVAWSLLPFMEHKTEARGKKGTAKSALIGYYFKKVFSFEAWKKLLSGQANVSGAMDTLTQDKEGEDAEKARKTSSRDILRDFERFRGRCFMVFGTNDPEAGDSFGFFEAWLKRQGVEHETHWIKGAPHNFYTDAWTKQVVAMTVEWVTRGGKAGEAAIGGAGQLSASSPDEDHEQTRSQ